MLPPLRSGCCASAIGHGTGLGMTEHTRLLCVVIPKGEAKSLSSRTSEARRDLVFDSGFLNPEIPPLRGRDPFVQNDKNEVTDAALGSLFFEQDISTNAYRFVHP